MMDTLFDYAKARTSDPETSHQAAKSVRRIAETQAKIMSLFEDFGNLTDEEIASQAQFNGWFTSSSGLRTRRSELVEKGLLKDSGERRRLESGRRGICWSRA